jgi:Protein of unknown function DUF262
MKINKNLLESAGFNPTKKTYQISTSSLCEKIEKQEITLPLYQRDVSWTLQKCVDLLNYQLLGKAPVAPISINEINKVETTDDYVAQVSFIDRELVSAIKKGQLSIADGQQRLTTNYKAYKNDNEFRNVVLDLTKGAFVIVEGAIKKSQIPVGMLLNSDIQTFFNYLNSNSILKQPEVMNVLMQVRNKMRDYSYTINLAEDLTEDQQIEWFEVLNNAGSQVTRIQMRFSKLKITGIDIYTQYTNKFKGRLEESRVGDDIFKVKSTDVSIPVAALNPAVEVVTGKEHSANFTPIPSDTRENQICNLDEAQILACFDLTLTALDKTIDFIENNNLSTPSRSDYVNYLVGLFVFNGNKDLTEEQVATVTEWYQNISFTNKSNSERRDIFTSLLELIK